MRKVVDLNTFEETFYDESNSPEDVLINHFLIFNRKIGLIYNENERKSLRGKIEYCGPNQRTLALGDFAIRNN